MKKKKNLLWITALFLCLSAALLPAIESRAASGYNLLQKVKQASGGTFVEDETGVRYVFEDGSCLTKTWKKIEGGIYYFNKKGYRVTGWKKYRGSSYYLRVSGAKCGRLVKGWKTISGKRYYFSKKTGAMVTGWQKIGGYRYYFNKKGVLQKGKVVGKYTLDAETGRAVLTSELPETAGEIRTSDALLADSRSVQIFIGDSRTVGLCDAVGGGYHDASLTSRTVEGETEYYYAKVGSGYSWFSSKAVSKLNTLLKKNPKAAVVLNHGINDLDAIDQYISSYRTLMETWPDAEFVIMAVNPVDTKKYKGTATPEKIRAFNAKLQEAFPDNYVDTYNYLLEEGYSTSDGLHYTTVTYQSIYTYVKKYL